jgi:hypothetical protein
VLGVVRGCHEITIKREGSNNPRPMRTNQSALGMMTHPVMTFQLFK